MRKRKQIKICKFFFKTSSYNFKNNMALKQENEKKRSQKNLKLIKSPPHPQNTHTQIFSARRKTQSEVNKPILHRPKPVKPKKGEKKTKKPKKKTKPLNSLSWKT